MSISFVGLMLEEAGLEAAGLRGAYFPRQSNLFLVRDATNSRDSVLILQSLVASLLRQRGPAASRVIVVASHTSPSAHYGALCRLGAAPAIVRKQVVIIDAQGGQAMPDAGRSDATSSRLIDGKVDVVVANNSDDLVEAIHCQISGTVNRDRELDKSHGSGRQSPVIVLMVDSSDALNLAFDCDIDSLVRLATSHGVAVAVGVDFMELGDPYGDPLPNHDSTPGCLGDLADTIVDITPLRTATEVDGRASVQKLDGVWERFGATEIRTHPSFFYRFDTSAIRYFR